MNKTTNISLYSLLLAILFFGSALIHQSCKGKKKEVVTDINAQLENFVDENDGESLLGDDETTYDEGAASATADSDDDNGSMVEDQTPTSTTSQRTTAPSSTSSYTPPSSSSVGGYMVIAGNYLVETNAQEMVRKLKNAGYASAEYAVFDLSQYRTVIAGRFSTRSRANEVSAQLKGRGFDNYVLRSKE